MGERSAEEGAHPDADEGVEALAEVEEEREPAAIAPSVRHDGMGTGTGMRPCETEKELEALTRPHVRHVVTHTQL